MVIGERIKQLREQKDMSQGDIQKRTGLLRCYLSRLENSHTTPSLQTIEKLARAFEIPLYVLFHDGESKIVPPKIKHTDDKLWGAAGKEAETLQEFKALLSKMSAKNRKLLVLMAAKLVRSEDGTDGSGWR
jgi:transcriptional regulator with XRE-family HTH domain